MVKIFTLQYTFFLLIFIFKLSPASAQFDTIMGYHIDSQVSFSVPPVMYNATVTSDSTSSFIGSFPGTASLPAASPTLNVFPGSAFTKPARADLFFNVNDYPVRTAVKIMFYYEGIARKCSGILTGPNTVLTAAHCTYDWVNKKWGANNKVYDSILVYPSFDKGLPNSNFGKSKVRNIYVFKKFQDATAWEDISVLELNEPLGLATGWVGLAFNSNDVFFQNKPFHKLSYPAAPSVINPSEIYNGDTLYYNYGFIDLPQTLGISSPSVAGIQGQSGSSLFYQNAPGNCHTFGVFNFSTNYNHYRIKVHSFYQLKNLLENYATSVNENPEITNAPRIYPNPATDFISIESTEPGKLLIFNATGKLVKEESLNEIKSSIPVHPFSSGIYIARFTSFTGATKTFRFVKLN
jgi:hypothetical protein